MIILYYVNKNGGALEDLYWILTEEICVSTESIFSSLSSFSVRWISEEKSILCVFILKCKTEQSISWVSKWMVFWALQKECSCFWNEWLNCTAKGSSTVVINTKEIIFLKINLILF